MSDQLTADETGRRPRSSSALRGPVLLVAAVLASYAAAGAAAGWLWHRLWDPSTGVVVSKTWYVDGFGLRDDFSGTGLYVLVAAGLGLVLGLVFSLAGARRPVLTVLAVAVGSALAAWLMMLVGEGLGPADPHMLAKTAADGTKLPSALRVNGLSPLLACSVGSLAALALVYTVFPGRSPERD